MKNQLFLFTIIALLASCVDDKFVVDAGTDPVICPVADNNVTCTIPVPVDDSDEATSRSSIYLADGGMQFAWDDNEKITVYPDNDNTKGTFTLQRTTDTDRKTGIFDGGGFGLTAGATYYTICKSTEKYGTDEQYNIPYINGDRSAFNNDARQNIKMSYDGQRQTVNAGGDANNEKLASSHLGAYDYMTSVATASNTNSCHFLYKRLGVILRIVIKGLPANTSFKTLTMYDASEDMLREMARTTNITNGNLSTGYSPYLNSVELNDDSKRFSVMLGTQDASGNEKGLSVTNGQSLVVYMMIPPIDLTNKTIAFRLTPTSADGSPYFGTYKRTKPFTAGTSVQMTMTAQQSTQYNLNIQVVHDWAKGNAVTQSRAAGDPGYDTKDYLPTYLYSFFVNDGKLVQMASTTVQDKDWTTSNGISTLSSSVTWSVTKESGSTTGAKLTLDNTNNSNPRVYIVASPTEITSWTDASGNAVSLGYGTISGTAESIIQSLTYNYPTTGTETEKSLYMQKLYSTPFVDNASYVGALTDDVKDVRLYHVASKVDINWENTTATALSGNVSVNNFPTTNLSFFKPSTANTTSGTSSVSTAITTGTQWNGRAVFYLPQPSSATYNVTIGGNTSDITFTPDATFTSWFRGLVTY